MLLPVPAPASTQPAWTFLSRLEREALSWTLLGDLQLSLYKADQLIATWLPAFYLPPR